MRFDSVQRAGVWRRRSLVANGRGNRRDAAISLVGSADLPQTGD